MAKAFVCVSHPDIEGGIPSFNYRAIISGPPDMVFSSTFYLNKTDSLQENIDAWKNHVISQSKTPLSLGDVIIFGAPVVKDSTSLTTKTNGITSDSTAVTPISASDPTEKGLLSSWMDSLKSLFTG